MCGNESSISNGHLASTDAKKASIELQWEELKNNLESIEGKVISPGDLSEGGTIIWPVVPKDSPTAIYYAQIKLITEISKFNNWNNLKIIVSDFLCKNGNEKFLTSIQDNLEKSGLSRDKIETKTLKDEKDIEIFNKVCCDVKMGEMKEFKEKRYNEEGDSLKAEAQKYILPLLQMAAIIRVIRESPNRNVIVIAGRDEEKQWERAVEIARAGHVGKIGAFLIPEMQSDELRTINQSNETVMKIISCKDENKLSNYLEENRKTLTWFYDMFVTFPNKKIELSENVEFKELFDQIWRAIG